MEDFSPVAHYVLMDSAYFSFGNFSISNLTPHDLFDCLNYSFITESYFNCNSHFDIFHVMHVFYCQLYGMFFMSNPCKVLWGHVVYCISKPERQLSLLFIGSWPQKSRLGHAVCSLPWSILISGLSWQAARRHTYVMTHTHTHPNISVGICVFVWGVHLCPQKVKHECVLGYSNPSQVCSVPLGSTFHFRKRS